jgi:hypothetical protein
MNYIYDENLNRLEIFISEKKSIVCLFCKKMSAEDLQKSIIDLIKKYQGD